MRIVHLTAEAREASSAAARAGLGVGLVPTMGSLHEGHLSLVRRCREACRFTVASIFVNPTQFAPGEDLEAYPRNLERDARLLGAEGVDLLFAPPPGEIYAPDHATWVEVEGLSRGLCGDHRPGHFRGVATVVAKLFGIFRPAVACFGQKDFQQAAIVRRLARDLDSGVTILVCPTVREADGLAMSSRNAFLSASERSAAPALFAALDAARRLAQSGSIRDPAAITASVRRDLEGTPLRLQYVELGETTTLAAPERLSGELVLAAAAHLGSTRLIDNVLIDMNEGSDLHAT